MPGAAAILFCRAKKKVTCQNPNAQIPKRPHGRDICDLEFGIFLGFGFGDLGFPFPQLTAINDTFSPL